MSALPTLPTPTWSPRQRQLLAALGLTVLCRRAEAIVGSGIAIEGDVEVLRSRLGTAILRVLALDPRQATRETVAPGRIRLHWPQGSGSLSLPPLPELRCAAAKRALWPSLRRLARSRVVA